MLAVSRRDQQHDRPLEEESKSLDEPLEEFSRHLNQCIDLIVERYRTLDDLPGHPGNSEAQVKSWFDEPLPISGLDMDALLRLVNKTVIRYPTNNIGTRMFAYVMSGGTQASVMADLITSALDQNPAKWHLGPSMTEIEKRVISWGAEFIGLPDSMGGAIVSGGSAANLTGLNIGRNMFAGHDVAGSGLFGQSPMITYASEQTHSSVDKSIEMLGLGSDNLRRIATRSDFTIDLNQLTTAIRTDRAAGLTPFCIIGNAGTVNTGAIDPLGSLADVAASEGLWFHVDGAYGGLACALPELKRQYAGLERADSIALDFHKWLYQPFEIGMTLVNDFNVLRKTFERDTVYLDYGANEGRFDISRHHFALSRNAKAFKVWMSFKAYGADRIKQMIRKDIDLARYLAELLSAADNFEVISEGPLGIVCFRYLPPRMEDENRINEFNKRLIATLEEDGRVFITGTQLRNRHVIRACVINHRMRREDIMFLVDTVDAVAVALVG